MGVTIAGIRIAHVTVQRDDKGVEQFSGSYELISSSDKVLAKQSFNGYDSLKVEMTGEVKQMLNTFLAGIKKDIMVQLGLE